MKQWLWLFFCSVTVLGQPRQGVIYESDRGVPLAFASIRCGDTLIFSDIDGRYALCEPEGPIQISVPGYKGSNTYARAGMSLIETYLNPMATRYSREFAHNKARNLIRAAIAYRYRNDPQRALPPHRFQAYNKLVVTAHPDSIPGRIDSVFYFKYKDKKAFRKLDSSDFYFKKYISGQHLFLSEKVSEFLFDGSVLKEDIQGARMAGFPQPVYEIMALRLQSFSVYGEKFEMARARYNGPLASDAFDDYTYRLQDSLRIDGRKVYAVAFFPRKSGDAFDAVSDKKGLSGLLFLDAQTYGVARAMFRFRGVIDITAEYSFRYQPQEQIWFPSRTDLTVIKGRYDRSVSILGFTLDFEKESATSDQFAARSVEKKRRKFASDFIYGKSSTWYNPPRLDPTLEIRHSWVQTEIADAAVRKPETYWKPFRSFGYDLRDPQSYKSLDSIAGKAGLQWKLQLLRRVIYGYIPLGPVDLRFTDIAGYNDYEGLRLGLGGITNERFSKWLRLEGYGAYGFRDTRIKYSLGGAFRLGKFSNSWIGGSYTDDIREIASTQFATDRRWIRIYDGRPFNITTFYAHRSWKGYLESRLIPKTESLWQLGYSSINPLFDYAFLKDGQLLEKYSLATAEVALQWNPLSEFMQTPTGRIETERGYPKFALQYTQAVAGVFDSDLSFGKVDFRSEYKKDFLGGQEISALLLGGWAYGDVPITQLYNSTPNNPRHGNVLERIRPAGPDGFETMLFNEFFSSRFFSFQFRATSQRFGISRSVKPSLGVVSRMAYGDIGRPEQHIGIGFKTLDQGYFESGLELNMIYSGLGIGGYYRYGANSLPELGDNFSIKISFKLDL